MYLYNYLFLQPYLYEKIIIFYSGGIVHVSCKDHKNNISTPEITTMKTTNNFLFTSEFTTMKPKTNLPSEKLPLSTTEITASAQNNDNLQTCED